MNENMAIRVWMQNTIASGWDLFLRLFMPVDGKEKKQKMRHYGVDRANREI